MVVLETKDILFELGAEELPSKSLRNSAKKLLANVLRCLKDLDINCEKYRYFATPRRVGFLITNVATTRAETIVEKKQALSSNSFDYNNLSTPKTLSLSGSDQADINDLRITQTDKSNPLVYPLIAPNKQTITYLPEIIKRSLKQLPINRKRHWGESDIQFIRPVHWVVLLFDDTIVKCKILGCQASNITYGHRFHAPEAIMLPCANSYIDILRKKGWVIADFEERKKKIISEATTLALIKNAKILFNETLIEEITAIVEWPKALCCNFNPYFLRIPQEVLVFSIQKHQKSLPMISQDGKLINQFIIISNIHSKNPISVITGNNRVMAARLSDADFFYDFDIRTPLKKCLQKLKKITFQQKLGSMFGRVHRIALLGQYIAKKTNTDTEKSYRAGLLSKIDLSFLMVDEFSELQGIIGKHYAKNNHEDELICQSIEQQYWPKQAGGNLPTQPISQTVALAEKIDMIVGNFLIGNTPSGDGDPLGLRRASIGVLRILKEKRCAISLSKAIDYALSLYDAQFNYKLKILLLKFFIDRLRIIYQEESVSTGVFEAVLIAGYSSIVDFDDRIQALLQFLKTPGFNQFCKSNKRVFNLLKNNLTDHSIIDPTLFEKKQETDLYKFMLAVEKKTSIAINNKDYCKFFENLLLFNGVVNDFFFHVMVMDKKLELQKNRLALLNKLYCLFTKIADVSKLA